MFDDFFQKAHELRAAGRAFATAVVVRAEKPTSGKPGDRAIVTQDGTMYGWIGGSCAQPTVVREAARVLSDGTPRLIRLSPDPGSRPVPEGIEEAAMTCFSGGTLDIFIEPHQPTPRLLVVGSLPVARALAHLGRAMSYHVIAVDPGEGDAMAHADEILRDPADIAGKVSPLTFAVVATHGDFDEPALKAILKTSVPYVGLVASRSRGEAVLASLERDGVDEAARSRVRFPAGLDIKAVRGDEIAVSILAEIVESRRRIEGFSGDEAAAVEAVVSEPETAVDPICGMSVQVAGAMHTYEHGGQTYYFCCGGCRTRFAADPEAYLAAG